MQGSIPDYGFVAKFNLDGQALWVTKINGESYLNDITSDLTGIYVTGTFYSQNSPIQIYSGPTGSNVGLTGFSGNSNDGLIIKYDFMGNPLWLSRISNNFANGFGITTGQNSVFVTGEVIQDISNQSIIYNGPTGSNLGLTGEMLPFDDCCFVIKLTQDGQAEWFNKISNDYYTFGLSVSTSDSAVYVSGYTQYVNSLLTKNISLFTGKNGQNNLLTGEIYNYNMFLAKLSQTGSENSCPIVYLNDSTKNPNQKTITYTTTTNNCVQIVPTGNNIYYPNFSGPVNYFESDQMGSSMNLVYSGPVPYNKWTVTSNQGFTAY